MLAALLYRRFYRGTTGAEEKQITTVTNRSEMSFATDGF